MNSFKIVKIKGDNCIAEGSLMVDNNTIDYPLVTSVNNCKFKEIRVHDIILKVFILN